jgi:hypothetical protein
VHIVWLDDSKHKGSVVSSAARRKTAAVLGYVGLVLQTQDEGKGALDSRKFSALKLGKHKLFA